MKRKFTLILFIAFSIASVAQSDDSDSLKKKMILDFAVPDAPALTALGNTPTNILRPSDPKSFALAISPFFNGKSFVLPSSLAIDFSPGTMFFDNRKLRTNPNDNPKKLNNIIGYHKNYWLIASSISIAALRDSTNLSKLAIGIKIPIINKAEPFNDKEYVSNIAKAQEALIHKKEAIIRNYMKNHPGVPAFDLDDPDGPHKRIIDSLVGSTIAGDYKKIDDDFKANSWNKQRMDLAIAIVASSADSFINKSMYVSTFNFWFVYADGFKTKWAQLLLGCNVQALRTFSNENFNVQGSVNSRLYVGRNLYKGFVELQGTYNSNGSLTNSQKATALFNVGAEFSLFNVLWLNLYGGVKNLQANDSSRSPYFSFDWKLNFQQVANLIGQSKVGQKNKLNN